MENNTQNVAEKQRTLKLKNGKTRQVPYKRDLCDIACDIRKNWKNVYFGAEPYLSAMARMHSITEPYLSDPGFEIVIYFLTNAAYWRGEEAQFIKAELKAQLKDFCNIDV